MTHAVLDGAALDEWRAAFGGELLGSGSPRYDEARSVFNAMIDRRPAVIARCHGVSDVIAALRFARERGLPLAIRGGGHSVAGHAVCDGGVVLDLSPMKGVRVDPDARTAWAQAGLNWGELDRETQAFGLAVTGGRVPDTGVAGLTLAGGSGWIERKHGYTCDNLRSVELVTADGRFLVADRERNPELFWALRGGGGNFGVVTAFELDLHEVGPMIYGGMLLYPAERAVELMKAYRDFMAGAPDEVGGACAVLCAPPEDFVQEPARGKPVFGVIASYVGPVEDGERAFAPLREWGPVLEMCGAIPYAQGLQRLIEPGNPPGRRQYWKAGFVQELADDAVETFVSHAMDVASPMTASILLPHGGAVARVPESETVLGNRDAGWNFHILSQWEDAADDERQIGWTRAFDAAMRPHSLQGVYANFVSEPPENVLEASFGAEKHARLRRVKAEYDPENVFRLNVDIRPGGSSNGR
jgi:FAD/FMN-containing dehydrogenase